MLLHAGRQSEVLSVLRVSDTWEPRTVCQHPLENETPKTRGFGGLTAPRPRGAGAWPAGLCLRATHTPIMPRIAGRQSEVSRSFTGRVIGSPNAPATEARGAEHTRKRVRRRHARRAQYRGWRSDPCPYRQTWRPQAASRRAPAAAAVGGRIFSIQKLLGLSASNQEHNKRLKMDRPNTVASEDAGRPVWRGTARDGTARTGTAHLAVADTRQRVTPAGRTAERSTPRLCSSAAPPGCSSAASGSATCRWLLSPTSRDWEFARSPRRRRSSWYPKFSTQDTALAPEYLSRISLN